MKPVHVQAGGNDQLQRDCRIRRVGKGKAGFVAVSSNYAAVTNVVATQALPVA